LRVLLVHDARFPVAAYGGTERVVWWLAKGLAERGHAVTLACLEGSSSAFAKLWHPDFRLPLEPQLGGLSFDVLHYFNTPATKPSLPHVVTIGGNGKPGEKFLRNTAFVSRNHAERHGATCYVHNGIDPDEYEFRVKKDDYLLFLAKASWRVKNVSGAIRIAKAARTPLRVLGGSRWWANPFGKIRWEGMVSGEKKRGLVAGSKALLFPVLWHEPFGLAVVEALVSGTPVLATPFGSLPELVTKEVGKLCRSEAEFAEAARDLRTFPAEACRAHAIANFHYQGMAEKYEGLYRKVTAGEELNASEPAASLAPEHGCELPARTGCGSSALSTRNA
jgi:glycosyltransferase involved in cell wall biosynthesis